MSYSKIIDTICTRNSTYIQYDPNLAKAVGMTAAVVYAVIHDHMSYLLRPNTETRFQVIENDGWFFYGIEYIAERAVLDKATVSRQIQKLIDVGILECRRNNTPGNRINYYRELIWAIDLEDYSIKSMNPYTTKPINGVAFCNYGVAEITNSLHYNTKQPKQEIRQHACVDKKSRRVSKPGQTSKKLPKKTPTENSQEWKLAKYCFDQIRENYPNHYPNRHWEDVQFDWEKKIKKIIKDSKNSIEYVQKAFAWALTGTDKQALFHKKQFKGVPGLLTEWKTGMHYAVLFEDYEDWLNKNSPKEDKIDQQIEQIVSDNFPKEYTTEEIAESISDIHWFYDKLERINTNLSPQRKFYWHNDQTFLKIVRWLVDLENNSKMTFRKIMERYLQFLDYRLQDGSIKTISQWEFTNSSSMFITFLKKEYSETGKRLTNWFRGDYE